MKYGIARTALVAGVACVVFMALAVGAMRLADTLPDGGLMVWLLTETDGTTDVYLLNPNHPGSRATMSSYHISPREVDWSPDGTRIAFSSPADANNTASGDIFVMDVLTKSVRNVSQNPASDTMPRWSPNGRYVSYTSTRDGNLDNFIANPDGSFSQKVSNSPDDDWTAAWSPDGRYVAYHGVGTISVVNVRSGDSEQYLIHDRVVSPTWSPDGQYISFQTPVRGGSIIQLINTATREIKELSADGFNAVFNPQWSPDGKTIALECTDGSAAHRDICVVDVATHERRNLTNQPALSNRDTRWSPDSQHILYSSDQGLHVVDLAGGERLLADRGMSPRSPIWSPDSAQVAFVSFVSPSELGFYLVNADGSHLRRLDVSDTIGRWQYVIDARWIDS
jgi:Tol biopolymer transport system component